MSSDLLQANVLMLVLAVVAGAAYVYMLRHTSPYAPRVQDYLGDYLVNSLGTDHVPSRDKAIGRAA